MAAPAALLLVLHSKAEFVRGNIAAGKVPSAPQTAAFIREVVVALGPHIRGAPPPTVATASPVATTEPCGPYFH